MEILKNLSFSIAAFLVGAVFLLLGILEQVSIGGYIFGIHNAVGRIAIIFIGMVFVGAAFFIELMRKNIISDILSSNVKKIKEEPEKILAEKFFYTLDDQTGESFSNMTAGAHRVSILSRTAVNLLGQYQKVFEHLGSAGCTIRLLFIDPDCEAARYVYGNQADVYLNNVKSTSTHMKSIHAKIGANLQARTTKHAPTLSIIIVEKQPSEGSFIRVQLYFLHSCVGRDRPIFKVNHSDKWYNVLLEEFNEIWKAGENWTDESIIHRSLK